VKARANNGAISLTPNEWFKARQFKNDYYIYAIMEAAGDSPELYIICNPVENLSADEIVDIVRYRIPFSEIKTKGSFKDE